ncbi:PliI family lysozyme inhibitor of I-type lysozyme [Phocaeicola sp. KGMB11183]|uniref:PliI family lysozyme inhibitor of I-type lysozyme n=1 Tax=Phocaeicola acetigenes TaxID=3016083 RepID=A0ABT4PKE7_9BACT|nr:PliI family lysozyme inhibitor of I-type lysozyme [Phocaeicola sp. KGMB11183]MCZ8373521.1 PliI family lysozyme inhibitor of I-type lysozyme [Phocaeicola sp. KGMB11183]
MKKLSSFVLCALLMSCSFSKNEKSSASDTTVKEGVDSVKQEISFNTELTYPGSNISFKVNTKGDSLIIQPSGLSVSNETLYHDITGYTVVNAEIGDLNIDSYPELFVYLTSDGSGSYGKLIGYSVNNGKSVSQVYLPDISENDEVSKGYMGHDEMAIVENTFCQRFPIYKEGDSNANPTGGIRQIQYKLVDGESSRILKIDKVINF